MKQTVKIAGAIAVICLSIMSSCTQRSAPAPVKELYGGKTYISNQSFSNSSYTVKKGDTLYSIAWMSGHDYRDIAEYNNIKKPFYIYPGQNLTLKKPKKTIRKRYKSFIGTTTKTKVNQGVDVSAKQAYGESEQNVNKDSVESSVSKFPNQVKRWSWPTNNRVTRFYSAKEEGNNGLDFNGSKGSPILAAADGKVVYTGNALRGYGNLIIIKHTDTFLSAYAHNEKLLVTEQQWVKAGQHIANMGSSGTDTVKLHFEVRYKGKTVNPLNYLPKR